MSRFFTLLFTALLVASTAAQAAPAAITKIMPTPSDKAFLTKAIEGDNSEIMLGQIAAQKGSTDAMRNFGQTLVTDHQAAKTNALALATPLGITDNGQTPKKANKEKAKLDKLSGVKFDKEFAGYMVKDHKDDIAVFQKKANSGTSDVDTLARNTLPTLQKHLDMAQSLKDANK